MNNYEEYLNERMEGMYSIFESSVVIEAANKGKKEEAENSLIKSVKKSDPEKAKKYEKDRKKIKEDKNSKAIINWILKHPNLARFIFGNMYVDNVLMANDKK